MSSPAVRKIVSLAASIGVICAVVFLFSRSRHVDLATLSLVTVLAILVISAQSGFAEAIIASLTAGALFDYFFLPAHGFGTGHWDRWIVLLAFLATAIIGSRLSDNARKRAREATARRKEVEKLYALSRKIQIDADLERVLRQVPEWMIEAFGLDGAAVYLQSGEETYRAGARGLDIPDEKLRRTAGDEQAFIDAKAGLAIAPLRLAGRPIGSVALFGSVPSAPVLHALSNLVEATLEKLQAAERTRRAEAVETSARLQAAVLDGLAHDLKTPLTSIRVAATCLLSMASKADPPSIELLSVIKEETNRLNLRVDEAINVARMEAGRLQVEKLPEDVRKVVDTALEELSPALAGRTVQIQLPAELPLAHFDFRLVKQVLKQLLENALKYSPGDSPVRISSEMVDGTIIIHVADWGPGIPEPEQSRIFERFYRGGERAREAPGVGMGLAIAKGIMEAHGDRIWVTSRPGAGSVFHFSLPAYTDGGP